uniref:Nesprin-4 isoform X3 n=1 Tax=Pogona vitticeps TaxID=103695 RepID=A0ABM5ERJ1_9SAUR
MAATGDCGEAEAAAAAATSRREELPLGCPDSARRPSAGEARLREKAPAGPLQELLSRLQDWLLAAEETARAACPAAAHASYAQARKELRRFEALRGQVSAKLWPLDALNRRYQQLGRSGAGDGLGLRLRAAVREVNQRWEALQARAAAVSRRLKHFVTQWEEFETEREALRLWLTELSLRLMDVEHFSGGTLLEKMTRLQAFQEDVQANAERMDRLLAQGERLIQKSQPEDAELLEEELQDLSGFCQEIFCRVFCFWQQLVSLSLVFEDAWLSDGERDPESSCFTEESLALDGQREAGAPWPPLAPLGRPTPEEDPPLCHAHQVPKVGGALELEWDPSVDVGSTSSRDEEDSSSSSSSCSAIPGVDPWEEPCPACQSSLWGSQPLVQRHSSQEGLWALGGFRGPWEQLAGSARDPKRRAAGTSAGLPSVVRKACPWGAPRSPVKEGSCCPVEPTGFEPQRPETWLGKSWQEAAGRQLAREESDGRRQRCRLPAGETYHPAQSQRSSQPAKRGKPEQLAKRRAKHPFFAHPGLGSNGQVLPEPPTKVHPTGDAADEDAAAACSQPDAAAAAAAAGAAALDGQLSLPGPVHALLFPGQGLRQVFLPRAQAQWATTHLARVMGHQVPRLGSSGESCLWKRQASPGRALSCGCSERGSSPRQLQARGRLFGQRAGYLPDPPPPGRSQPACLELAKGSACGAEAVLRPSWPNPSSSSRDLPATWPQLPSRLRWVSPFQRALPSTAPFLSTASSVWCQRRSGAGWGWRKAGILWVGWAEGLNP